MIGGAVVVMLSALLHPKMTWTKMGIASKVGLRQPRSCRITSERPIGRLYGMTRRGIEHRQRGGGPPQKQKKKKGKTGEKAFLSRILGKWTGFRSRAAFGRSGLHWNSRNSGNWDWTGRQLRLSPF